MLQADSPKTSHSAQVRQLTSRLVAVFVLLGFSTTAFAQKFGEKTGGLGLPPMGPGFSLGGEPATFAVEYELQKDTRRGTVKVVAEMAPNWHMYSVTQPPGGPLATAISLVGDSAKVVGDPEPDHDPEESTSDVFPGVPIEEHFGKVVWTLPIELAEDVDPEKLALKVKLFGQVCEDEGGCLPINQEIEATFTGFVEATGDPREGTGEAAPMAESVLLTEPVVAKPLRVENTHAEWQAELQPYHVRPGQLATLVITAKVDSHYHVYQYVVGDEETNYRTNIAFTEFGKLRVGAPVANGELVPYVGFEPEKYYEGPVSWSIPLLAPDEEGIQEFEVRVAFFTCKANGCDPPAAISVKGSLQVGGEEPKKQLTIEPLSYRDVAGEDFLSWIDKDVSIEKVAGEPADVAEVKDPPPMDTDGPPEVTPKDPEVPAVPSVESEADISTEAPPGIEPAAPPKAPEVEIQILEEDTPELLAEMAALYDVEEKIRYLNATEMDEHPIGSGGVSSANNTTIWSAIFGAFVGGMILNLMPCVFPVLGLKVMSFVKQAGGEPARIRMHGIAFTAGLVVSMWVLAGILLALRTTIDLNWGAQLSNPFFVAGLIVLLFLLGLNMSGVFEFGNSLTQVGGAVQGKEGYAASFFSGVLTTLIATPCSGPFLGAAMSYTLAQSAPIALILFTIFALGIAVPYLILSFSPNLIGKLPRPGAWMETFKVTMGFLLFASVAFFIRTFASLTGASGISWLAMGLVIIGLAAYYYGRFSLPHLSTTKRILAGYVLPILIAACGGWISYEAALRQSENPSETFAGGGDLAWHRWTPGRVEYLVDKRKAAVWVDYTADW